MLHRAILGSLERFIGILIEQFAGRLPLWLAPTQIVIATIVSDANAYAEEIEAKLFKSGLRVECDLSNESINYKVREHSLAKTPIMLVLGKREAAERKVTLRYLGSDGQDKQENLTLDEAVEKLKTLARPPHLQS
jgi:threonyl-tRNA synthetase